ncbi:MAG: DUF3568 family protein [Candidatus Brocadiia bacterium]
MSNRRNGRATSWARRCALALCIAGLPMFCGCVVLGVGVVAGVVVAGGAIVYVRGNLTQPLYSPAIKVHAAAVKALDDLKLTVMRDKTDANVTTMESEFGDGTHLRIEITAVNPQSANISIRVGFWGDEPRAREVLEKIQSHL